MSDSVTSKFKILFFESIFLGIIVGFIPEFFYSGFKDALLTCPYDGMVDVKDSLCITISIEGYLQMMFSMVVAVLASIAALVGAFGKYK